MGRQGRPWPPHFLGRTWATPYDHALIDKHPGRTVLFGRIRVQIDGAAANDSSRGTGMLINTFENSEHAYSQDHEY